MISPEDSDCPEFTWNDGEALAGGADMPDIVLYKDDPKETQWDAFKNDDDVMQDNILYEDNLNEMSWNVPEDGFRGDPFHKGVESFAPRYENGDAGYSSHFYNQSAKANSTAQEAPFSSRFPDFAPFHEQKKNTFVFTGASNSTQVNFSSNRRIQEVDHSELINPQELPSEYWDIFPYPSFNKMQSTAFTVLTSSDQSTVISAPTGSGKTVAFELAIVRLLEESKSIPANRPKPKIIYMAPVKALCTQRLADWAMKFNRLGVNCVELTGDTDILASELLDQMECSQPSLILTTPEKWDSLTRKWRSYRDLVLLVKLFLIDEVHLLNEEHRGPTLEAVVSRMRTVQSSLSRGKALQWCNIPLRFIAASATIPNADDIAQWLRSEDNQPAAVFRSGEETRPVELKRVVLGYPFHAKQTDFKFDISLNYKLPSVLSTYANGKPTLIFCSTRKGAQQTAVFLSKNLCPKVVNQQSQKCLDDTVNLITDSVLRENILRGVGFHHAGLALQDRRAVEDLFCRGHLPVLVCTTTLALGVNLPAHLVVVKSTTQIMSGGRGSEYPVAQLLQMIGRAGRPQFDTSATAVIMTKSDLKGRYETILTGALPVESCLHRCLKEHLNAEIVLKTITDINLALTWIQSTYLYVRATKDPKSYGVSLPAKATLDPDAIKTLVEQHLYELCLRELNALSKIGLVTFNEFYVSPTPAGQLMARFYIGYGTMALFAKLKGDERIADLVQVLSSCAEFSDVQLRTNERATLNKLNKDRQNVTIRYPFPGRVSTKELKVNCLLQATLGNLNIAVPSLSQECPKILQLAQKVAKCLKEYLWQQADDRTCATALLNAVILTKCLNCKLWEDSPYVSKQIERIGPALSKLLAEAGYVTFKRIASANPRELEKVMNRAAPFGTRLNLAAKGLPEYTLSVQQLPPVTADCAQLQVSVKLANIDLLVMHKSQNMLTAGPDHAVCFLVSSSDNTVLYKARLKDEDLLAQQDGLSVEVRVFNDTEDEIHVEVHVISNSWAGFDTKARFTPVFEKNLRSGFRSAARKPTKPKETPSGRQQRRPKTTQRVDDVEVVAAGSVNPEPETITISSSSEEISTEEVLIDDFEGTGVSPAGDTGSKLRRNREGSAVKVEDVLKEQRKTSKLVNIPVTPKQQREDDWNNVQVAALQPSSTGLVTPSKQTAEITTSPGLANLRALVDKLKRAHASPRRNDVPAKRRIFDP